MIFKVYCLYCIHCLCILILYLLRAVIKINEQRACRKSLIDMMKILHADCRHKSINVYLLKRTSITESGIVLSVIHV